MPLPDLNPLQTVSATHYRKLLYLLSGKLGDHQQQVALTGFDDDDDYALVARNRGTDGLAFQAQSSDGTDVFHVNDDETRAANFHLVHQTAPATVPAGSVAIYATTDNILKYKTSAGAESTINAVSYGQNYLVNPGFEIWSRGVGPFVTTGAWTADKWYLNEGAASTTSITRAAATDPGSAYALTWSQSATGAKSRVTQDLEDSAILKGKTVTFSMRVKTAYANAVRLTVTDQLTSSTSSYHTGGNSYETLSCTLAISTAAVTVSAHLDLEIQGQIHTGEADNGVLSISSGSIPYEPLPQSEELARCRRFYQVVEIQSSGRAYDATDTVLYGSVPLTPPISIQLVPTVTQSFAVVNVAGASATFTHTLTGVSATGDSYSYHTLKTTWTKAATNTEDAYITGSAIVEVRA